MFDALLKSKFYSKCKTDLKKVRTRIEFIKKKRNATQKYLRSDVTDLLKNGLDQNAYDRAEGLLAEMDRSQCYEIIDQYCDCISKNLSAMNKQRECLQECREAAAGLMFAAARFADLPELRELRTIFSERYGNSLDYYVNKQFSEKLKAGHHSNDAKLQLLQDIAAESGFEWSSKAFENKLFRDAYNKNLPKETNDSELSSDDHRDGSVQKHARAGSRYEFYPAPDLNPDAEKGNGQKENRSPPVKDIPVDTIRKPQEDEDEPLKHKRMAPPYTKDKVKQSEPSDADENLGNDDHVLEEKAKAKSIRTRSLMPLRSEENGGNGSNMEKVALGQRILKFFDGGGRDQRDEEEKNLDNLLEHYSRKKVPHESSDVKPTHQRSSTDVGSGCRDVPSRVSFLPESRNPAKNPKTHSRAASFHPDGHVHPKLPDYDDFVARLAAYRGK